ncbi:MAG: amino acid ABC transporter ATP-binding protein [Firmicutes bacterium]|nr:amino acid ABC transporter ATP-binding protein [Bacillota bacterium]
MAVLEVENIRKEFGKTVVLRDVSFELEQGHAIAIIGSSGSGKTTLLRCLNFLERPDGGIIRVKGEVLFDANDPATHGEAEIRKKRLHFGMVFQAFNLFPQYTALHNVTLASELLAKERYKGSKDWRAEIRDIENKALSILEQMGLADKINLYPYQLSGGQQQRVAIARALALQPDILCFDEPTSALDPELTGEVLRVIRSLAEKHTTMAIVTHEMAFARDVADEVIFLDNGLIVERGKAKDVIDNPQEERTQQFLARYTQD